MPDITLRGGEVDGLAIHYVVAGRGPAVVLLHGLGGFAQSWRHTIDALATRATVFALDLPGCGRSAKPRTAYRLGYFARALHAFLDALGVGQASLVGHSLGGAVAVTYALTHPTRVERLALVAGLVPGFSFRMSWAYRLIALPGVGEALGLCGRAPLYKAAIARCFHVARPDDVDFLVDHRVDYRRAIATLDLPVLLVHGRQDPAVSVQHATEAAAGFPRAALRWVDGCGHFPHLEHAPVVNGWLAEFVVGRPAPR